MGVTHIMTSVRLPLALVYLNMTIIFQMINFLILLWILNKFLYKKILATLDKRAEGIKASLDEATRNKEESQEELERIRREYNDAKHESFSIREQAREIAERERERIIRAGRAEHDQIVARAKKDMDQEFERTKDTLRRHVAELSVEIAQKILRSDLSDEQRNRATSDYLDAAEKL